VVSHAVPGQTIILTSTSYVGSTRRLLVEPLAERDLVCGRNVFVAFSPERIDPGNAAHAQDSVPRVVGGVTPACAEQAASFLGRITSSVHVVSSPEAAEPTKLYENTFRAVNIALANEIADVSEAMGMDVTEVIAAASTKPFGFMPFYPGTGVGGHCIPCDPHYLLWGLRAKRGEAPLVQSAMDAIASRPRKIVDRAVQMLAREGIPVRGARIVVAGVAYKPGVEDVRESPALEIIERLVEMGAQVQFVDRLVGQVRMSDGSTLDATPATAIDEVDLAIVHVLHPGADDRWIPRAALVLDPGGALRRL
jgi:nucleotide sugar dehydrogenase